MSVVHTAPGASVSVNQMEASYPGRMLITHSLSSSFLQLLLSLKMVLRCYNLNNVFKTIHVVTMYKSNPLEPMLVSIPQPHSSNLVLRSC